MIRVAINRWLLSVFVVVVAVKVVLPVVLAGKLIYFLTLHWILLLKFDLIFEPSCGFYFHPIYFIII